MALKIFLGIVIVAIAIPVLFKIFCWFFRLFMFIRFLFMTLEQQEEYYEKEYNYFQEDTREYPDDLIFNLKTSCEDWKKYWSQEVEREENETDEDFKEMLELQKERIEFWDKAVKSIETELWYRNIRNSNK